MKEFDLGTLQNILTGVHSLLPGKCLENFRKYYLIKFLELKQQEFIMMHKALLKKIIEEKWFTANGVIGFWPATSNNADTVTFKQKR